MSSLIRPMIRMAARPSSAMRFLAVRHYADMSFTFSSPNEVLYNQATNVKQVDVPTLSGSIGILANHVPTLGVLKPGVVTVTESEGAVRKFFVSSGSVAVNPDSSVQLLAEEAFPMEKLDVKSAQAQLAEAQRALAAAKSETERAEAQIAIDTSEAVVRAIQTGI